MPRSYWEGKRVVVTGARGFVGRHLISALMAQGCAPYPIHSRDYDLRYAEDIDHLFVDAGNVDVLFHLAAYVGGIGANQRYPAAMYSDNVLMDTLLIEASTRYRVGCFVGMGSVCAYPKLATTPFVESDLWNGYPEETNAAYGIAKRGMLACLQAYGQEKGLNWRYALPTNLYGPGHNYGEGGHVIAALIRRFSEAVESGASSVTLWGDGKATRDFLYVSDAVRGLMLLAERGIPEPINFGSGREISISGLSRILAGLCNYDGEIVWDETKPNGQPRRVLEIVKAYNVLGWQPEIELEDGLVVTIHDYGLATYA